MKKSYFRHDYNARNDIKLQSVITKHGAVGIGVYWIIVEMLYQNGGELPLDIARNISVAYFTDFKVVESVINDFDLFENDGNVFWSVRIRQTIDNTKKVSDARKAASRQRWSRKQEKPENPESRKTASHPPAKEELSLFTQPEEQKKRTYFKPPTVEEVAAYVKEKGYSVDAEQFVAFYESMDDWQEQNAEMESGGRNMATQTIRIFRRKGNNARTTKFNQ